MRWCTDDMEANLYPGCYSSISHPNHIFNEQPQLSVSKLDLEIYWAVVKGYQESISTFTTPGSILQHRKPGGIIRRLSTAWSVYAYLTFSISKCDVRSAKGRFLCGHIASRHPLSIGMASWALATLFLIANNLQIQSATTHRCWTSWNATKRAMVLHEEEWSRISSETCCENTPERCKAEATAPGRSWTREEPKGSMAREQSKVLG